MKPINGMDVPEGGQAVFEVVVTGQPLPEVAWYHEGRPIQHGPDFQVKSSTIHVEAYTRFQRGGLWGNEDPGS